MTHVCVHLLHDFVTYNVFRHKDPSLGGTSTDSQEDRNSLTDGTSDKAPETLDVQAPRGTITLAHTTPIMATQRRSAADKVITASATANAQSASSTATAGAAGVPDDRNGLNSSATSKSMWDLV